MTVYVRDIKDQGMGAFSAPDDDTALKITENKYGADNVEDVREATQEEMDYIRGFGGFVPSADD